MNEFITWLETHAQQDCQLSNLAGDLARLLIKYNKERTQEKHIYIWRSYMATDRGDMDDIIFTELSKHINGYPDTESEWENVELHPYDLDEYLKWQEQGYRTEVE